MPSFIVAQIQIFRNSFLFGQFERVEPHRSYRRRGVAMPHKRRPHRRAGRIFSPLSDFPYVTFSRTRNIFPLSLGFLRPAFHGVPRHKFAGQKRGDDFFHHARADTFFAEREHIGVVVIAGVFRAVRVVTMRAAHAGNFIGDNGNADSRGTDDDSPFAFAPGDALRRGQRVIGIIARIRTVRSEIDILVSVFHQIFDQRFFEIQPP